MALEYAFSALDYLFTKNSYTSFTRENDARAKLMDSFAEHVPQEIILEQFFNDMINPKNKFTDFHVSIMQKSILSTFNKYGKEHVLAAIYKLITENNYSGFTRGDSTTNTNYRNDLIQNLPADDYYILMLTEIINSTIEEKELDKNLEQYIENSFPEISNFRIHPAYNECKEDIIKGIHPHHKEYFLENMYAYIDVGNYRSSQEDSVLLLQHPQNPNFKFLAVADGMGGHEYGEKASNMVLNEFLDWFENLDPRIYYNPNCQELQNLFNSKLIEINNKVYDAFDGTSDNNRPGTTFVGAITTQNGTIVSNVGDSRAYILDNHGELYQISEDHNILPYLLYNSGLQPQDEFNLSKIDQIRKIKDDFRFHPRSNMVTQSIGLEKLNYNNNFAYSTIIDNNSYSTLLLFSDGVTDCLSDEQIKVITKKTSKSELAKSIVKAAKTTNSINPNITDRKNFYSKIPGGKDNTTAAVFNNDEPDR